MTPQTLSDWLYRRKRPSLDKYLAFMEFATQNAAMEMPPRVRKLLNELEAYAKRNRIKQKDFGERPWRCAATVKRLVAGTSDTQRGADLENSRVLTLKEVLGTVFLWRHFRSPYTTTMKANVTPMSIPIPSALETAA
jgi:hypothetical protein